MIKLKFTSLKKISLKISLTSKCYFHNFFFFLIQLTCSFFFVLIFSFLLRLAKSCVAWSEQELLLSRQSGTGSLSFTETHAHSQPHTHTHTLLLQQFQPQLPRVYKQQGMQIRLQARRCENAGRVSANRCLFGFVLCEMFPFFPLRMPLGSTVHTETVCALAAQVKVRCKIAGEPFLLLFFFFSCTVIMTACNTSAGIMPPSLPALLTPVILASLEETEPP